MLTKVTFRLAGYDAALTAAAVTRRLGLQPASAFEADTPATRRKAASASEAHTPVTRRKAPRARGYSLWLISSSPQIEPGVALGEQLRRLLAILEPVTSPLWELADADTRPTGTALPPPTPRSVPSSSTGRYCSACWRSPGTCGSTVCGDGAATPQPAAAT